MFRNLSVFNLLTNLTADDFLGFNEVFSERRFVPCAPSQESSYGWVEPRGKAGEKFVEVIDGQVLLKLCVEGKRVPGGVLKDALALRVAKVMEETGRTKLGRKEKKELKDEVKLDLIVKAFPSKSFVSVWLSVATGKLFVDTTSSNSSDRAVSQLIESIFETLRTTGRELKVTPVCTTMEPTAAMSSWLVDGDAPGPFDLGRNCELVQVNGQKTKIRYVNHSLQIPEVVEHIKEGMRANRLELTMGERITFVLGADLCLRNIDIRDTDVSAADEKDAKSSFDAAFCLATREISPLFEAVQSTLGRAVVESEEALSTVIQNAASMTSQAMEGNQNVSVEFRGLSGPGSVITISSANDVSVGVQPPRISVAPEDQVTLLAGAISS